MPQQNLSKCAVVSKVSGELLQIFVVRQVVHAAKIETLRRIPRLDLKNQVTPLLRGISSEIYADRYSDVFPLWIKGVRGIGTHIKSKSGGLCW